MSAQQRLRTKDVETAEKVSANKLRTLLLRLPILDILLLCLLLLLFVSGFQCAAKVDGSFTSFSLRYDSPVSGTKAYQARVWAVQNDSETTFWPTYWSETTLQYQSEFAKTNAYTLLYSGDAALVWPAVYINGAAPGTTDAHGCAISAELAYILWGNTDIVGKEVSIGGEDYIVRGVFNSDESMAIVSYGDEQSDQTWQSVELAGGDRNTTVSDVENFARSSGLGTPDSIVQGSLPTFISNTMAVLPLVFLFACVAFWLLRLVKKRYGRTKKIVLWSLLAIGVLLLPSLILALPNWMIPDKWSDFSFWSSLIDTLKDMAKTFLTLNPSTRDVAGKVLLIRQAVIFFASSLTVVIVAFRYVRTRLSFKSE